MNKGVIITVLLVVGLLAVAYAVYRSTAQTITTVENGQEVIYGVPQHGLLLGLCILSGICIISSVALLFYRPERREVRREREEESTLVRRSPL